MTSSDDLQRYIEYLQRSQHTPELDRAHDAAALRQWVTDNRSQLEAIAKGVGGTAELVDDLERRLAAFTPTSAFDSFTARTIFEPILTEVLDAARAAGLPLKRQVVFANSTDSSHSAAAVPSSSNHLLFAGVGTYAFCNYWAKAIAGIASAYSRHYPRQPFRSAELHQLWTKEPPVLMTVVKLTAYARAYGSLMGFGVMPAVQAETPFRLELLRAMEIFAIAHEVAHCYFEEKHPNRAPSPRDEFACDLFALPISRTIGNQTENWTSFTGVGAYVFLRAAAISSNLKRSEDKSSDVSTHPESRERASEIINATLATIAEDQLDAVKVYLGSYDTLFNEFDAVVDKALKA